MAFSPEQHLRNLKGQQYLDAHCLTGKVTQGELLPHQ